MKHASGCPIYTASWFVRFMRRNPWPDVLIHVLVGLFVALKGKSMLPTAMGVFACFWVVKVFPYYLASEGYMEDGRGISLVFTASLLIGITAGSIIRRSTWLAVRVAGIGGGMVIAVFSYGVAVSASGSEIRTATAFYIWWALGAVLGGLTSFKYGKQAVLYGTSFIGSKCTMHGWFLIFGGFPEEVELFPRLHAHEHIKLRGAFAIHVAVLVCLITVSIIVQKRAPDNEEVVTLLEEAEKQTSHIEM